MSYSFPMKWAICATCDGEGRHSQAMGWFTASDLAEQGSEWCQDYFDGRFDMQCEDCSGSGKVKEIDEDLADPAALADHHLDLAIDRELRAEEEAERRAGC